MASTFQKNLTLLREKNPFAAFVASMKNGGFSKALDDKQSDLDLSKDILGQAEVLIILGLGTGAFYFHYQSWLSEDQERTMVFIEEDEKLLCRFLYEPKAEKLLQDPQVEILLASRKDPQLFKDVGWKFLFQKIYYVHLPYYPDPFPLQERIKATLSGIFLSASDYKNFGVDILENIYQNFLGSEKIGNLAYLSNAFANVPAIICGSGPSLDKNMHLLKKKSQKALIFAGGSAIDVLSKADIPMHFTAGVDPDPDIDRFKMSTSFEAPFFFFHRLKHSVFLLQHGLKILAGSPGGYPIEDWLYRSHDRNLPFLDGGWDVSNFCTSVACHLGCNPIILVGMDHCGTKEKMYAKNTLQDSRKEDFIPCQDIFGNPVFSKNDWLMSVSWFKEFAEKHPDLQCINATEGGLWIEGLLHVALSDVLGEIFPRQDWNGRCHAILEQSEKIRHAPQHGKESLMKIKDGLERILDFCSQILSVTSENKETANTNLTILEAQLESEIAFQYIIEPIWSIWKFALQRKIRQEKAKEKPRKEKIQQMIFFQQVANKHIYLIHKLCQKKNT
ncbi:MAG: motility associated factor glycosyltransferase family protein [Simkaniaceae bacterium]